MTTFLCTVLGLLASLVIAFITAAVVSPRYPKERNKDGNQ